MACVIWRPDGLSGDQYDSLLFELAWVWSESASQKRCMSVPEILRVRRVVTSDFSIGMLMRNDAVISGNITLVGIRVRPASVLCDAVPGKCEFIECAANFVSGKCKCPFMSGVVGPIVLPDLYGK